MYCAIARVLVSSHRWTELVQQLLAVGTGTEHKASLTTDLQGGSYTPGAWFAGGLLAAVSRYSEQVTSMAGI